MQRAALEPRPIYNQEVVEPHFADENCAAVDTVPTTLSVRDTSLSEAFGTEAPIRTDCPRRRWRRIRPVCVPVPDRRRGRPPAWPATAPTAARRCRRRPG